MTLNDPQARLKAVCAKPCIYLLLYLCLAYVKISITHDLSKIHDNNFIIRMLYKDVY